MIDSNHSKAAFKKFIFASLRGARNPFEALRFVSSSADDEIEGTKAFYELIILFGVGWKYDNNFGLLCKGGYCSVSQLSL